MSPFFPLCHFFKCKTLWPLQRIAGGMHYSVCKIKSRKVKGNWKIRGGRRTRGSAESECDMRRDKGRKIRMEGEEGRVG